MLKSWYNMNNGFAIIFIVKGEWRDTKEFIDVVDPLNGGKFLRVADTKVFLYFEISKLE